MLTRLQRKNYYVVSVLGEDRIGIVAGVTQSLFEQGFTIVDIEQTVIHSQFTMALLIRPFQPSVSAAKLRTGLSRLSKHLRMKIMMAPLRRVKRVRLAESKKPYVFTILGPDRPGVVAAFSSHLAKWKCNIERIKMISRGGLGAMEMSVDLREASVEALRSDMAEVARETGVDLVLQPAPLYQKRKKVVAFDMDSTIVDAEIINELANLAGVGKEVAAITERGMQGKMDFMESIRERVALLKGLDFETLEALARTIRLTQGSEELVGALKEMGFKLALITGGSLSLRRRSKRSWDLIMPSATSWRSGMESSREG